MSRWYLGGYPVAGLDTDGRWTNAPTYMELQRALFDLLAYMDEVESDAAPRVVFEPDGKCPRCTMGLAPEPTRLCPRHHGENVLRLSGVAR